MIETLKEITAATYGMVQTFIDMYDSRTLVNQVYQVFNFKDFDGKDYGVDIHVRAETNPTLHEGATVYTLEVNDDDLIEKHMFRSRPNYDEIEQFINKVAEKVVIVSIKENFDYKCRAIKLYGKQLWRSNQILINHQYLPVNRTRMDNIYIADVEKDWKDMCAQQEKIIQKLEAIGVPTYDIIKFSDCEDYAEEYIENLKKIKK